MIESSPLSWKRILRILAAGLMILAVRWWLVDLLGNRVPYWDQWVEADSIIKPFLAGNFSLADLFAPHNQQPVVPAKMLALISFWLNGQWSPLVQSTLQQFIPAISAVVLMLIFCRQLGQAADHWLIGGVLLLWTLPFAHQVTLNSIVVGFHVMTLCVLLTWWGLVFHAPLRPGWWVGVLAGGVGCLAMGSGFFALIAVIIVEGLAMLLAGKNAREWLGRLLAPVLILAIFYGGYFWLPGRSPPPAQMPTVGMFMTGIGKVLAWPWIDRPWLALVLYAPAIYFGGRICLRRIPPTPLMRFLFCMILWAGMQAVAMGVARQPWAFGPSSRYMDILALGALANFALLLYFLNSPRADAEENQTDWGHVRHFVRMGWLAIFIVGLGHLALRQSIPNAWRYGRETRTALVHARDYLRTGDMAYLRIPPNTAQAAPIVHATALANFLHDPAVQAVFPPSLFMPELEFFPAIGSTVDGQAGFMRGGLPTGMRGYHEETVLGSFTARREGATGEFSTAWMATSAPQVMIPYAGHLNRKGLSLFLVTTSGKQINLKPRRAAKKRWFNLYTGNPGEPFRLVGKDASAKKWFAVAQPRGVGRIAQLCEKLRQSAGRILIASTILLFLLLTPPRPPKS